MPENGDEMKHRNRVGKYSVDSVHSGRKLWPVWQVALIDALVVGVWVGKDDFTPMESTVTGGTVPAEIFRDIISH